MSAANETLDAARRLLAARRAHDARSRLEALVAAEPDRSEAHLLLGRARQATNDLAGADQAFAAAQRLDPASSEAALARAELLIGQNRAAEAETLLRSVLDTHPTDAEAARRLARILEGQGRYDEGLQVLAPFEAAEDFLLHSAWGSLLKQAGRKAEALAAYERALRLAPDNPVAHHNIAAARADLGLNREAEAAARRALELGVRAPETHLVLGHALQALDRLDEAEAAYRAAIAARPTYVDAHRDLGQLIWTRTEDVAAAIAPIDAALARSPAAPALPAVRAQLLAHAGDDLGAYHALVEALPRRPDDASLVLVAAQQAGKAGLVEEAVTLAERAVAMQPQDPHVRTVLVETLLGVGDAGRAAALLEELRVERPHNQHTLALQATAWRLLGDPRYESLYDYLAFVRPYQIDIPAGWRTLDSFLADLAEALGDLHVTRTHPVGQSLRHGSQTNQNLLRADHPAIQAFPSAIEGPIRAHMARLRTGSDPLRSRNTGDYAFAGIWSVRLRPGGFHIDHVHPEGWLSSACYVALPKAVKDEGRQGWIRFGQPGIATRPALEAQHFVRPEPGMLVLFPSYMWHGTVPFEGDDDRRLTIAFDLVPA